MKSQLYCRPMPILFFYSRGGQIRPAKTFCPARCVAFSTHANCSLCNIGNFCSYFWKLWPKGRKKFIKRPADKKKLPIPVLQSVSPIWIREARWAFSSQFWTTFKVNVVFRGCWGSGKNWLKLKIEPTVSKFSLLKSVK